MLRPTANRAVASGPAGQAPVLINYVDTHAQMQQLSAMVLLRVESRLNILHSCLDLLAASFFATANLLAESVSEKSFQSMWFFKWPFHSLS